MWRLNGCGIRVSIWLTLPGHHNLTATSVAIPIHAAGPTPGARTAQSAYPSMLAPLTLAGKTLRNRVVHLSMTTFSNRDAKVGPTLLNYCASRARGGAAMLVTEPISMARHHHLATRADAWNDTDLDGLSRLAHAVESEDCRLIAQLLERGRARNQPGRSFDGIGIVDLVGTRKIPAVAIRIHNYCSPGGRWRRTESAVL